MTKTQREILEKFKTIFSIWFGNNFIILASEEMRYHISQQLR